MMQSMEYDSLPVAIASKVDGSIVVQREPFQAKRWSATKTVSVIATICLLIVGTALVVRLRPLQGSLRGSSPPPPPDLLEGPPPDESQLPPPPPPETIDGIHVIPPPPPVSDPPHDAEGHPLEAIPPHTEHPGIPTHTESELPRDANGNPLTAIPPHTNTPGGHGHPHVDGPTSVTLGQHIDRDRRDERPPRDPTHSGSDRTPPEQFGFYNGPPNRGDPIKEEPETPLDEDTEEDTGGD